MKTLLKLLSGLVVVVVLALGVGIGLSWAPDRSVSQLSERWGTPPSQFVELEGMAVHLRDEGRIDDPVPIVLLHGTSASLHTWDGWVAGLRDSRRVIRFDMPGFGLTGPNPSGDYHIERYVELVVAALDHLGIERAVLAGNSFGGLVAWETAWAHPDRVSQLVLVDASGYPLGSQSVPIGFRLARLPVFSKLMLVTLPRGIIESSVRNVYGDPSKVTPELVDRYYELTLRAGNRAALPQRFAQVVPGEHASRIPQIRTPALILWGRKDRLIPLASGEHFARDIQDSQLVVFDELGHVPHEENPQVTLQAVQAFVAGVP